MNRHDALLGIRDEIVFQAVSSHDFHLIKEAGLWEEIGFDSIASSIKNVVKNNVLKEDSPEGYLDALGGVLLSGTLFKIHPVLGIAYSVANALGVDISGIVSRVFSAAQQALSSGKTLSESDFNSLTKSACEDFGITKEGQLFGRKSDTPDIPFLPGKGEKSVIARIFGNLFMKGRRTRASWLAKGIIIWALKTALLGAGILTATGAATGLVKGLVGKDSTEQPETAPLEQELGHSEEAPTPEPQAGSAYRAKKTKKLRPSGAGTKRFRNDTDNLWIVPLINRNVRDTILAWTEEIYPQLSGYDHIIERSPAFKRTVDLLGRNQSSTNSGSLLVPPGFTSRKQIVDLFAHKVAKDLVL